MLHVCYDATYAGYVTFWRRPFGYKTSDMKYLYNLRCKKYFSGKITMCWQWFYLWNVIIWRNMYLLCGKWHVPIFRRCFILWINHLGAVHKVRHARRGRGPRRCDSLWQGEGAKSMWRHTYKFFYHTYETWNLKWCLTFCCNRCVLSEEGMDKNHPGQNLSDKRFPDKTPRTKTPANDWERICTRGFCLGSLY